MVAWFNSPNLSNSFHTIFEPLREKTGFLLMRKQRVRRRSADQRLCFRYTDGTIPLLFKPPAILCGLTARCLSDLVESLEDWFSHKEAPYIPAVYRIPLIKFFEKSFGNKASKIKNNRIGIIVSVPSYRGYPSTYPTYRIHSTHPSIYQDDLTNVSDKLIVLCFQTCFEMHHAEKTLMITSQTI